MKFLRHLFAIYGILAFALTALFAWLGYLTVFAIGGRHAERRAIWVTRLWGKAVLIVLGIRLAIYGREKLHHSGAAIFVSNHQSMLDIPITSVANPLPFKFLSKAEAAKIPVVGLALKRLYVLVDRSDTRSRVRSLEVMRQELASGMSIHLYVEGTRNKGPHLLQAFQNGAFQLAKKSDAPIFVLTIINSFQRASGIRPWQLTPGQVTAYWDGPILPAQYNHDPKAMASEIEGIMHQRLSSHLPENGLEF